MEAAISVEETRSVLSEAVRVFEPGSDVDSIVAVKGAMTELQGVRAQQLQEIKATLREWSAKTAAQEERLRELKATESHQEQLQQLEEKKYSVARSLASAEEDCQALERTVRDLSEKLEALRRQREAIEAQPPTAADPSVRYKTLLYSNITRIRWDLGSDDIKGVVFTGNNDMHPFVFNPQKSSPYFVADYLWGLL